MSCISPAKEDASGKSAAQFPSCLTQIMCSSAAWSFLLVAGLAVGLSSVDVAALPSINSYLNSPLVQVALGGWLTCFATGLGAIPFNFIDTSALTETTMSAANCVACGMMVAASVGMLTEAWYSSTPFWHWEIVVGLMAGVCLIKLSQFWFGDEMEPAELMGGFSDSRDFRKAVLIFTVMFCHSAAEGVAIGVAFDEQCEQGFGAFITIALAIHNVPEGVAVCLSLVPTGMRIRNAAMIAVLTSLPQPILASVAFHFVDHFKALVPVGLAFAAGAMLYVACTEMAEAASHHLGQLKTVAVAGGAFASMSLVQKGLEEALMVR